MFCTGCGIQSGESDLFCGGCGNAQRNTSGNDAHLGSTTAIFHVGQAMQRQAIPEGVRGWSWGAFFLNWIWAVGNNTWIGLLALVPYVNLPVMIWLGFKGREMAWRNRRWDNIDHFNRVQRAWSQWGIGIAIASFCIMVFFMLALILAGASQSSVEASETAVLQHENGAAEVG